MNLSTAVKRTRVSDSVSAGTSEVNSAAVDMVGFDNIEFVIALGPVVAGAVTLAKLQTSSDGTTWSDLTGTSTTIADTASNQIVILDCLHVARKYVRCVVTRGTQNAAIDSIVAQQYAAREEPVTHDTASVLSSSLFHAPEAAA
ncbi:MAG: hypothetical protein AAF802_18470 [Planctomycetota bacterium]